MSLFFFWLQLVPFVFLATWASFWLMATFHSSYSKISAFKDLRAWPWKINICYFLESLWKMLLFLWHFWLYNFSKSTLHLTSLFMNYTLAQNFLNFHFITKTTGHLSTTTNHLPLNSPLIMVCFCTSPLPTLLLFLLYLWHTLTQWNLFPAGTCSFSTTLPTYLTYNSPLSEYHFVMALDSPLWFHWLDFHFSIPKDLYYILSSVQFSRSGVLSSLQSHESQHTRSPCPSPSPGVHSDSCPLSPWCHPAIASSVVSFSFCPQSLPASESSPMSQLFAWCGQIIGALALASFLPKKSQGWSPSEWTGWISLQSKGLSRVFCNTTVQKHQFFGA